MRDTVYACANINSNHNSSRCSPAEIDSPPQLILITIRAPFDQWSRSVRQSWFGGKGKPSYLLERLGPHDSIAPLSYVQPIEAAIIRSYDKIAWSWPILRGCMPELFRGQVHAKLMQNYKNQEWGQIFEAAICGKEAQRPFAVWPKHQPERCNCSK